jgi:hypothetical protein
MKKQSAFIVVTWILLSQQLGLVEGRYSHIRAGAGLSPKLSTLDELTGPIPQDTTVKLVLDLSVPSQVHKTYVFPRSLNPDCAAGVDMVMGVTQLHFEGVNRTSGNMIFVNSLHWLFRTLKEAGELPAGAEMTSPRVIHDSIEGRFFLVSTMTDKESFSKLYLAISKDSAPRTGTEHDWDLLVFDVWDYWNMMWANELAISVDDQAIYITATMYKTILEAGDYLETDEFVESRIWVLKKTALLATLSNPRISSQAIDATLYGFEGGIIASVIPLDLDGVHLGPYIPATIPDPTQKTSSTFGTYLVALHDQHTQGEEYLHVIRMGNTLSTSPDMASYMVNLGDIQRSEEALPNAKQPDPSYQPIQTGNRRVADAVWQSDVLHIATTLRLGEDQTAVFWAKMEAESGIIAPSTVAVQIDDDNILQTGIIAAAAGSSSSGTSTFYPSIAVSPLGDMVVGYGASGTHVYAGMYASVATPIEESPSIEIQAGEDNYESIDGRAFHGQYSGMSSDPVDTDCFWAFNAFSRVNDPLVWNTWERGALAVQWGKVCIQ